MRGSVTNDHDLLGAVEDTLEGSVLRGKYRVGPLLGRGGMGSVYAAEHVHTGRKLAVKLLASRFLDHEAVVERFGREARAASAIQHPGIVEVLDLDRTSDGVPYIVMERLSGETLADRLDRREKLPHKEVVEIARQLLEALDAAHAHGVVHRDLKPDNIHLIPRGGGGEMVKILDFGISAKEDERVSKLTQEGSVLGTPHYMAPEQALGEARVDGRADLYALGVVLYESLVGDVPFDAPNYNRLIYVILNEAPRPVSEHVADIPPRVEALVMRLLEKTAATRFQSAQEVLDEIKRLEDGAAPSRRPSLDDFKLDIPAETGAPPDRRRTSQQDVGMPSVAATGVAARAFGDVTPSPPPPSPVELELDDRALSRPPPRRVSAQSVPAVAAGTPPLHHSSYPPHVRSAYPGTGTRHPSDAHELKRPFPWLSLVVAAALLAVGAAFVASRFGPAEDGDPLVAPTTTVRLDDAPAVDDGTAIVEVRHLPYGARLRLDGLPTGDPPLRLRRSDRTHVLEVRAPGYETRRIEFVPTRDLTLSGSLRPQEGVGR